MWELAFFFNKKGRIGGKSEVNQAHRFRGWRGGLLGSVSVQPSQPGSSRVNKWRSFCCCFPLQGVQVRLCNPSSLHTPCPSRNTPVKPCLRRLSNMLAAAFGCSRASPALCHPINISALTPVKHRRALKCPPGLSSLFAAAT